MIIVSPAKTFKKNLTNIDSKDLPIFNEKSIILRNKLKNFSVEELEIYFKIKGKTLEKTFDYFNKSYKTTAIHAYDGTVFKELMLKNIDWNYIKKNTYILDAMYGIINGSDVIELYRLDFTKKLGEINLYNYWRDDVNDFIKKNNPKFILNLCSNEYSKILNDKEYNNIINIEFAKDIKSSVEKKKIRGKILNYCINNNVEDYFKLNNLIIDNYKMILESEKNTFSVSPF